MISPYFVGLAKELEQILAQRRSAVTTQYGRVGKPRLVVAFAVRAERQKQSPGGVILVVVDGEVMDVIEISARFVYSLTGILIGKEERYILGNVLESCIIAKERKLVAPSR